MKYQLYYPSRQEDQIRWLQAFQRLLPEYAERLKITPERLADTMADLAWLLHLYVHVLAPLRRQSVACTAIAKDLTSGKGSVPIIVPAFTLAPPPDGIPPVRPGALKRLFKLVQGIKASPGYDEGIGLQLGIVGNLYHAESDVPTFKLRLIRGDASCEWVKGTFSRFGNFAVYVQTRRGGGDWETLSRSGCYTGSSFVDKRPLLDPKHPEVREYRLCFWENSVPQGNWTEVKSLTVSP